MRKLWMVAAASLLSTAVTAKDLEINLGSDSIRGEYISPIAEKVADNVSTLDVGLLYKDDDKTESLLGHIGLLVFGDAGAKKANIQIGVGARAVILDAEPSAGGPSATGGAVALGGSLGGRVPSFNRLGIKINAFFAPDVSAFGDIDDFFEYGISLDYQLIRQAYLVAGYRKIRVGDKASGNNVDLDAGAYGGLRFNF